MTENHEHVLTLLKKHKQGLCEEEVADKMHCTVREAIELLSWLVEKGYASSTDVYWYWIKDPVDVRNQSERSRKQDKAFGVLTKHIGELSNSWPRK